MFRKKSEKEKLPPFEKLNNLFERSWLGAKYQNFKISVIKKLEAFDSRLDKRKRKKYYGWAILGMFLFFVVIPVSISIFNKKQSPKVVITKRTEVVPIKKLDIATLDSLSKMDNRPLTPEQKTDSINISRLVNAARSSFKNLPDSTISLNKTKLK